MAGNREYDEDRFRQLVLYIAWVTRDDERFGRIKLAKTLFYSDLAAYAEEGQSLTGTQYVHWEHGPFPPTLYNVQRDLVARGLATIKEPRFQGDEARLIPSQEPTGDLFRGHPIVDHYIAQFAARESWQVRDASHEHPGWQLTEEGEEIPYHVAYMSRRRPTERDLARGEQLAREHGWP